MKYFSTILLAIILFGSCKKNIISPPTVNNPSINEVESSVDNSPEPDDIGTLEEPLEGEFLLNQSNNIKFTQRQWQGIPSVQISDDDILYTAWYSGGPGEGPGNYITLSMSKDKGLTWSKNTLIINPTNPAVRFFDPAMWKDKYGNVFLSWAKSKDYHYDGRAGVWYSKIAFSDTTLKCSPARRLGDGVMMNKPAKTLDLKKTYYPIAVWRKLNTIYVYETTANDKFKRATNFNKKSTIAFDSSLRNYDEHQIVQLKDSTFLCMIRGVDGIYITRSDNLKTWEIPEKFTQLGATTSARFFLARLKSGKIALIMNNSTTRNNLKIFLSDDEAKTWKYSMVIDSKDGVSYPDLTEDSNGTLYVTYDYNRNSDQLINCISFAENDIIANKPANIKRYVVDKK